MKILVYPHDLAMGGSQLNAIEIAAEIARQGHEIVVFGRPGRLLDRIDELGLEFVESPDPRRRPSPAVVDALRALVRARGIDVLHGYEWPPSLECWTATTGLRQCRAVSTVMSMSVAPFLPRTLPLVVGTQQIAAAERQSGRSRVSVLEPPVDLRHNGPDPAAGAEFRRTFDLDPRAVVVVIVTRIVAELKLEGLLTAVRAMTDHYADRRPVQLVIVGDGDARPLVQAQADRSNSSLGRRAVVLTGELLDPRPAYAAADVVLGMGGSALRALAFGKPVVVQGEQGFWQLLTEHSLPDFRWTGWYGVGDRSDDGAANLARALAPVIDDERRRAELGAFGRQVVEQHHNLRRAADLQLGVYRAALDERTSTPAAAADLVRSGTGYLRHQVGRKIARRLGRGRVDDFNARPVVARGPIRPVATG